MMEPFLHQSTERLTLVLTKTVIVSKVDFMGVHSRPHAVLTLTPALNTIALLIIDGSGERIITGQLHILAGFFCHLETPSALRMRLWSDGDL
jgi:hypothetical protein